MGVIEEAAIRQNNQQSAYLANMSNLINTMAKAQHQQTLDQIAAMQVLAQIDQSKKEGARRARLEELKLKVAERQAIRQDYEELAKILDSYSEDAGAAIRLKGYAETNPKIMDIVMSRKTGINASGRALAGATKEQQIKKELNRSLLVEHGLGEKEVSALATNLQEMQSLGEQIAFTGSPAQMKRMEELAASSAAIVRNSKSKLIRELGRPGDNTRQKLLQQFKRFEELAQWAKTGQRGMNEQSAAKPEILSTLIQMFGPQYQAILNRVPENFRTSTASGPVQGAIRSGFTGAFQAGRGLGRSVGLGSTPELPTPQILEELSAIREAKLTASPGERVQTGLGTARASFQNLGF